jgi:hypothetical protein
MGNAFLKIKYQRPGPAASQSWDPKKPDFSGLVNELVMS